MSASTGFAHRRTHVSYNYMSQQPIFTTKCCPPASALSLFFALATVACGSQDTTCLDSAQGACASESAIWAPEVRDAEPLSKRLDAINVELVLGSQGDEVRAVHEYLTRYGYFPNATLSAQYARWTPIVENAPADPELFDEHTVEAVRAFQSFSGLPATGSVDEATLLNLRAARCGYPDGRMQRGANESLVKKYSHRDGRWDDPLSITYRVDTTAGLVDIVGSGASLTKSAVTTAVKQMFDVWMKVTNIIAFEASPLDDPTAVDVLVNSADMDFPSDLATGRGPDFGDNDSGGDIKLSRAKSWSNDGTPTSNEFDLKTVLLHEIGHTLGIDHSSFTDATMDYLTRSGERDLTLTVDDTVAVSFLYDGWFSETWFPQNVRDIGVGGDSSDADIVPDARVVAGANTISGGYEVRQMNLSGKRWDLATGNQGAMRIAVGQDGRPWIVTDNGSIFKRSTTSATSGSWGSALPGCATDIGVGGPGVGTAWVLGCTHVVGGYAMYRWNGTAFEAAVPLGGSAKRIAVDAAGVPWVIQEDGRIWNRTTTDATSGTWQEVVVGGRGTDIGVGPSPYPWIVNATNNIFVLDTQPSGGGDAAQRNEWLLASGGATAIAVGSDAQPWVIGPDQVLYWRQNP